jgi:hypothetical protein
MLGCSAVSPGQRITGGSSTAAGGSPMHASGADMACLLTVLATSALLLD